MRNPAAVHGGAVNERPQSQSHLCDAGSRSEHADAARLSRRTVVTLGIPTVHQPDEGRAGSSRRRLDLGSRLSMRRDQPPRPVAVGNVVAVYSEALGAWTASQVTGIDAAAQCVAVVELDWSGPEPETVADLGDDAQPLRLTHHSWGGSLS
ncbi:hypothetical protein ABZ446_45505 [Streptomyces sp. NPDC005813]|uniref:hypothetical protein n=1 Tax=Streptomyces sp. NPDC005813 TaxID=3155592 RepID=UPI0033F0C04F